MEIPKVYDPKKVEEDIYRFWEKTGFFNPENLPGKRKKVFCILLPPPNITGTLHMGHALNSVIQDILIRYKRLCNFKTLWVPGTDHAGIATQRVVEKELQKEGKSRFDIGREEFLKRVWQWKEKYGNLILQQFKKLGCSLDWSRNVFTLDSKYSLAVKKAFLTFYEKKMIYKAERVVNWCPNCRTSLSDLELEYVEKEEKIYYIRYHFKQEPGYVVVATTRPETIFGDQALAFNPKDQRYKNYLKKTVLIPIVLREIPIIADLAVDPKFGTGMMKVTPAHDFKDYEISLRHGLKLLKIITEEGKMGREAPLKYQGLDTEEAKKRVVKDLEEGGYLEKVEKYIHKVPVCYRCSQKIEFLPSPQWFLKMDELKKLAEKAVKEGKIKFYPKRFEKIYFSWLEQARDWCISRQIWWGHKIPLEGEEDVLDTWFSSALWPFAVFGWPKKTKDLKTFFPSDVLVTAKDIINFWVARMIFCSIFLTKKYPFKKVFIHPTVLTKEGKRMSKSLGIGVDPLELIEKYGADATRFGLIWQMKTRQDLRFSEDHLRMAQKFLNKIWNAFRFLNQQLEKKEKKATKKLGKNEKKIQNSFKKLKRKLERDIENFELGKAAEKLYHFFWHRFCDFYIEHFKKSPQKNYSFLLETFKQFLICLHPFMPFITEKIYQMLPERDKKSIMVENWN
jgi:valyl-tRNA synthetase